MAGSQATARAWLDRAGIWDCLREGKVPEARARAAVASLDQQALDGGSWLLAGKVTLEQAASVSVSGPAIWAARPCRELIDPRWADVLLHRVKGYLEAKRLAEAETGRPCRRRRR